MHFLIGDTTDGRTWHERSMPSPFLRCQENRRGVDRQGEREGEEAKEKEKDELGERERDRDRNEDTEGLEKRTCVKCFAEKESEGQKYSYERDFTELFYGLEIRKKLPYRKSKSEFPN